MSEAHTKRIIYLHGFASSPASRKAVFLASRLRDRGYEVSIPALDRGDFPNLTIGGMLQLVTPMLESAPAILIGSSLGGYLAALLAARSNNVKKLVLLAPAFGFHDLWTNELGPEKMAKWQHDGSMNVFHYATACEAPIRYNLIADAAQYEPFPEFPQPTLIVHGTNDNVVPIANSDRIAEQQANVQLVRVSSGHELTDVLDFVWKQVETFLDAPELPFR